ncbi:MAG: type II toxin-antitoxin system RelE/ParE family toxin [Thermodesulfovibrionales bacterium]
MYEVILSDRASDYYEKQPIQIQKKINKAIDSLEINPLFGPNIKTLVGKLVGLYRYRTGKIRIIYQVFESEIKVIVVEIGPRGDVYKKQK